ncbi:MAG: glycoside hydrolase family 5 protein [Lachnospiraceae bacterium]|nr:glycoside hydrolase family 5 protein [Lachnospiraceae bacterium]
MRDMTTMELVQDMGIGINLGNTFESCGFVSGTVTGYETGWGSPVITQKILDGYAACGFGVLRIPVAWSNLMGEDYTISEKYLARVTTVVDGALNTGMYVILNIHWDGGWWDGFAEAENKEECMYKYTRIWTQLSEAFRDYGDHLMFESLNEEGCWDSLWNRWGGPGGKTEAYGLLNEINQKFVDIVRASGGNNKLRHLLIAGYATDIELTCDALFVMPDDPAGRMAVSVHYYTPSTFAILEQDASWGKAQRDWGTEVEYKELAKNMDMMKEHFIDQGVPVIIGEYGSATKNKEEGAVTRFLTAVCEAGYTRGMCPVLWDTTNVFYNRNGAKFKDPELLAALNAVKELPRDGK